MDSIHFVVHGRFRCGPYAYAYTTRPGSRQQATKPVIRLECLHGSLRDAPKGSYPALGPKPPQVPAAPPPRFLVAVLNTPLIAPARPFSEPMAARTSNTRSKAYSVRSCPSSSFHNRASTFIFVPSSDIRAW